MARNQAWDGLEFSSLNLPYKRTTRELSEEPRLISGTNSYVDFGGKITKRPGTIKIANTDFTKRLDRLWIYQTIETPPKVYLVASAYDTGSGTWGIYYNRLDGGSPGWTSAGSLRQLNASTRPHEAITSRGKFYIKGYPSALSGEKLGTVIFDGSGVSPTTTYWGVLGPSTPATISGAVVRLNGAISSTATAFTLTTATGLPAAPFNIQFDYELITVTAIAGVNVTTALRGAQGTTAAAHADQTLGVYRNWTASAHPVTVNLFWEYSYAYVTATGQVSNRAPAETNPDNLPSLTGPFINLIPSIVVQGQADTTNIPKINIYRTTDGGGTLFLLDTITNTGAGNITYQDNTLVSTSGQHDPVPDTSINTQAIAPSLISNSPPPSVTSPSVVGVDTPVASSPIAYYAGRFWYAIGNYLFYSANEELNTGVPEEAWPSGFTGNFFLFQNPVQNLVATSNALYVDTLGDTYIITGTLRETFNPRPILNEIGAPFGHPRGACRYQDAMVWLTNDLRIAVLQGLNFRTASDYLGDDLVTAINAGAEVDIKYWAELDKEWIVVSALQASSPSTTQQWIYDVKKTAETKDDFWNAPWTIPATAVASGRIRETESQHRLIFYVWDGANGYISRIASLASEKTGTDAIPGNTAAPFSFSATTALFMLPPGNHVNAIRRPGVYPVLAYFQVDRTKFNGDTDPTVVYYEDDLWTTPITPTAAQTVPRTQLPIGYSSLIYPVDRMLKRVALGISKPSSSELFELQDLAIIFNSDKGT